MAFWVFGRDATTKQPRNPLYLEADNENDARTLAIQAGMEVEFVNHVFAPAPSGRPENLSVNDPPATPKPKKVRKWWNAEMEPRIGVAIMLALVLYLAPVLLVIFDEKTTAYCLKVFGPRPMGVPYQLYAILWYSLGYIPIPLLVWHYALINDYAEKRGVWLTSPGRFVFYLFFQFDHPHARYYRLIFIAGVLYAAMCLFYWSIFAASRGG